MIDGLDSRYVLERFFCDTRAGKASVCPMCDGPISKGDRIMTDPAWTKGKPADRQWAHRSCVIMPYSEVIAFKKRRRHALAHAKPAPEAPAEQLSLFGSRS